MKKIFTAIGIIYLAIGVTFALSVWSKELRSFECRSVVISDAPFMPEALRKQLATDGVIFTGSFKNPDSTHCTRRGFDAHLATTLPYLTVAWPFVIGAKLAEHRVKTLH